MVSLGVADMDRSIVFYRDILGLELRGEPGEVTLIDAGAFAIALNRPLGAASNIIVGATEIVFQVDSVTEAWQRLLERGCKFATPVREIFSGTWAATFTDPDGHRLTIMGPP
jgi:predicted enzyme related to lactoylglutathione lyase